MKTAIVCSGGGASCSYLAGLLLSLTKKHKFKTPDLAIGASGSAITLAYYVSGQYKEMNYSSTELLCSKQFIDKKRIKCVVDIDHLIDDICKKQVPLNVKKIKSSKTLLLAAATNARTGEIAHLNCRTNIFEKMRATLAMPIVYRKEVKVGKNKYIDTYTSSTPPLSIKKAVELGAEKILVVDFPTPRLNSIVFNLFLKSKSKLFRENYYKLLKERRGFRAPKGVKIYKIKPKINVTTFKNDKTLMQGALDQGYRETTKNKKLAKFLK